MEKFSFPKAVGVWCHSLMSRNCGSLKHWFFVVAWMLIIFGASSNIGASRNTSRFIGPIVRWLYPQISEETLGDTVFLIRKAAHVTEYAILAILTWRALRRQQDVSEHTGWSSRSAFLAWLISAGYAMSDEIHQTFVPSRSGAWEDVALDSFGALLGVAACWIACRIKGPVKNSLRFWRSADRQR